MFRNHRRHPRPSWSHQTNRFLRKRKHGSKTAGHTASAGPQSKKENWTAHDSPNNQLGDQRPVDDDPGHRLRDQSGYGGKIVAVGGHATSTPGHTEEVATSDLLRLSLRPVHIHNKTVVAVTFL